MTRLPLTPYDTICVSGGFDPVHIGHLRMIREAAEYGKVIVIVNSDKWLMRKKGYIFMPFEERCEILRGFSGVEETVEVNDDDETVCEALQRIKPIYFANGGDRKTNNTPEMKLCKELGIELLWGIGGRKIQSSSNIVDEAGVINLTPHEFGDLDLKPSKILVMASGDISKKSKY